MLLTNIIIHRNYREVRKYLERGIDGEETSVGFPSKVEAQVRPGVACTKIMVHVTAIDILHMHTKLIKEVKISMALVPHPNFLRIKGNYQNNYFCHH